MSSANKEPFGNINPWSEPAWCNALASPYYNDSHKKLRQYAREYIDENIIPYQADWEENGAVPREESIKYAKAGFAFQDLPKEWRGGIPLPAGIPEEEWDIFHEIVLHDEQSRIYPGVAAGLSGASPIGAPPIVNFGTKAQKDQWLSGIFTGETSFCLGATEPSGGSDLAQLKTTAVKSADGKEYVVNGKKKWITGAMTSTHMTTAVRTGGPGATGVSVLIIALDSPGVSIRKIKNSGANAGGSAWVDLENVKVPADNLIGRENFGFQTLMSNFNSERLSIAIGMNRKARTCMSSSFEYAHDRVTFGKPLISNQIMRHKFTTMARYIESHWAWIEQICYHAKVNGRITEDLASRIALAKIHGGRLLELANREAQQVFGGAGYQRSGLGSEVEQISRDLRMLVVGGGSEEILSDLAVRQELSLCRKKGSKL